MTIPLLNFFALDPCRHIRLEGGLKVVGQILPLVKFIFGEMLSPK